MIGEREGERQILGSRGIHCRKERELVGAGLVMTRRDTRPVELRLGG